MPGIRVRCDFLNSEKRVFHWHNESNNCKIYIECYLVCYVTWEEDTQKIEKNSGKAGSDKESLASAR